MNNYPLSNRRTILLLLEDDGCLTHPVCLGDGAVELLRCRPHKGGDPGGVLVAGQVGVGRVVLQGEQVVGRVVDGILGARTEGVQHQDVILKCITSRHISNHIIQKCPLPSFQDMHCT